VHGSWIVSLLGLVLIILVGSEAVRRQAAEVYLVRNVGLVAVIGGFLAFVAGGFRRRGAMTATG
jgi:uncharacterized membrane protein